MNVYRINSYIKWVLLFVFCILSGCGSKAEYHNEEGLYLYNQRKYDDAINAFQFAILAKNDFANGYYNLAAAYAAKNQFEQAISAMNTVLTLVPKDSADYKLVQSDLETLQKKQKTLNEATDSANLTSPQKAKQAISPPLELPSEASPPAGPSLATPSPSTTPNPTPNP